MFFHQKTFAAVSAMFFTGGDMQIKNWHLRLLTTGYSNVQMAFLLCIKWTIKLSSKTYMNTSWLKQCNPWNWFLFANFLQMPIDIFRKLITSVFRNVQITVTSSTCLCRDSLAQITLLEIFSLEPVALFLKQIINFWKIAK